MAADEAIALLAEVERLRAENRELRAQNEQLAKQIAELAQLVADLESRLGGPPSFVKRNRPKSEDAKKPRRKRAKDKNHGRRIETPTRTVEHRLERCPKCNCRLGGKSLHYARQVIELPPPQPVEVIEHRVFKCFCPRCGRWQSPKLDLTGQVFGKGRMGVRITSTIAYLRNTMRLPIQRIQSYLLTIHQLQISTGEIVELLHDMRRVTHETVEGLKKQALASDILHADETGWRKKGRNGFIWALSTPGEQGVRYYEHDHSRGHAVIKRILAGEFHGHLVTDFYAAYNDYEGAHQRCWVHLLRDLHELREKHSQEADAVEWAEAVRKIYDQAKAWLDTTRAPTREQREMKYVELVSEAHRLGLRYGQTKKHPCQALAKRLLRAGGRA